MTHPPNTIPDPLLMSLIRFARGDDDDNGDADGDSAYFVAATREDRERRRQLGVVVGIGELAAQHGRTWPALPLVKWLVSNTDPGGAPPFAPPPPGAPDPHRAAVIALNWTAYVVTGSTETARGSDPPSIEHFQGIHRWAMAEWQRQLTEWQREAAATLLDVTVRV